MSELLSLILWVILTLYGLLTNKYKMWYAVVVFIYLSICIGLNYNTPDYDSYRFIYTISSDLNAYTNTEFGFKFLCYLGNLLGLTFEQFRFLFSVINAWILVSAINRLTLYSNHVLGMYLIYPFIGSISGMRFTMASALVLFALPWLLQKGMKGKCRYVIFVLMAATLHMTVLFYLVFVFALQEQKMIDLVKIVSLIAVITLIIRSEIIVKIASVAASGHLLHKLTRWLSLTADTGIHHLAPLRFLAHVSIVISFWFISHEMMIAIKRGRTVKGICGTVESGEARLGPTDLYHNVSMYMMLIIPTFIISAEYQRMMIGMLPVYYALFSEYRHKGMLANLKIKNTYMTISWLCAILYLLFFMVTNRGHFDYIGALSDNYLLKMP